MAQPAWRALAVLVAALIGALLVVIILAPASLLSPLARRASDGRLALPRRREPNCPLQEIEVIIPLKKQPRAGITKEVP